MVSTGTVTALTEHVLGAFRHTSNNHKNTVMSNHKLCLLRESNVLCEYEACSPGVRQIAPRKGTMEPQLEK